jgi:von Willebrand factor type A domain
MGGCGANSKWAQITAAINNVVSQTDTTVNWGLKFFADKDATCGVNPGVAVPVAPMNSGPIAAAITASTSANGGVANGSSTPTAQAIVVGTTYLGTLTDPNPKYLLVATDGLPNCATGKGSGDNSPATEQAVAAALTAGYPTFVVGIATTSDAMATATLNAMAVNGGEPQTGGTTSYYSVTDTASLETALNKIIGIVGSCTISLATAPTGFTNVAISATDASGNTVVISPDPTNGWSYDATKANVILNGTACADLQNGTYSNFQFYYACAGTTICIDRNAAGVCAGP